MEKISIVKRRRENDIETDALIRARQREEMRKNEHTYIDSIQQQPSVISLGNPDEISVCSTFYSHINFGGENKDG